MNIPTQYYEQEFIDFENNLFGKAEWVPERYQQDKPLGDVILEKFALHEELLKKGQTSASADNMKISKTFPTTNCKKSKILAIGNPNPPSISVNNMRTFTLTKVIQGLLLYHMFFSVFDLLTL